jgi:uncharacterized protein (DUF58 family)
MAARCSLQNVLKMSLVLFVLVGVGLVAGTFLAVGLGLIVGLTLLSFAVHGGWSLAQAMDAFADRVPAEPETTVSTGGSVQLRWPSLGLTVEGEAQIVKKIELEAVAGGVPLSGDLDEAETLAQNALAEIGVDPVHARAPEPEP